jgi:hypothetical protein
MMIGRFVNLLRKWDLQVLLLLALMAPASSCFAQSGAGSIQGTVTDKSGAAIPGASIHVVNKKTSVATDTTSTKIGFYQVPDLFAGDYTVTVSADGMSPLRTNIELLVDQHAVVNAALRPGTSVTVDVTADNAQLVTVDNGTIAYDLDNKRIDQLPQNGRLLLNETIITTPGLEGKGTGNLMVNGLEAESMEFVADGVPLSNRQFGGVNQTQGQLPDPDSVQEVRVETTNVSAQYATPGVAIITTKSGTSQLHGTVFETIRNNAVGIAKNRNNLANFVAPHLVRNEFGGSLGGPIIIPHLYNGKNRTFFFLSYERYSLSQSVSEPVQVPTTAWRNGDFSDFTSIGTQLYDPNTTHSDNNCNGSGNPNAYCRAPFANNQIPIGRLAPTTKVLYDITPQPNVACDPITSATTCNNYIAGNPNYTVIPNYSGRLDHNFNQNNRAYVRFTGINQTNNNLRNNPNSPATLAADGLPANASGIAFNPTTTYAAALGYNHIFSPSFFSETIFSQQWFAQHNLAGGCPTCNLEKQLGTPNNFGNLGFPQINSPHGGYGGNQFQYGLSQIIWTVDENLTKTFGHHQLQFGGRYRLERFNDLPDQSTDTVNFNSQGTGLANYLTLPAKTAKPTYAQTPNTGASDADFFLGNVSSYTVNQEPFYFQAHDMETDLYFQDTFRVLPNLTLDLGLRWEDHPSPLVYNNVFSGFDYKNAAQVLSAPLATLIAQGRISQATVNAQQSIGAKYETAQDAGLPSTLIRNYALNFLPRLGFAWQPHGDGKTVIRGGYGRYLFPTPTRSFLKLPISNSPFLTGYTQNFTNPAQTVDGILNEQLRYPQSSAPWSQSSPYVPILGTNSATAVNSNVLTGVTPGLGFTFVNPNFAPMFSTEVNLTFEQSFKWNQGFRMSWVHTHGTNFDHQFNSNNAPSTFVYELQNGVAPNTANGSEATRPYNNTTYGGITEVQKNGWSNYDALQANYEKRAQKGLAFQVFYTWAKGFRVGDNAFRDSVTTPYANYLNASPLASGVSYTTAGITNLIASGQLQTPALPPPPPTGVSATQDYHDLIRFENYQIDTNVPQHHVRFNAVVDLPFGRNKRFLGKANRLEDELIGGWQIATSGQVISQSFFVNAGNWGSINPIQRYNHGKDITDCSFNPCARAKLWFNGFINPTATNGVGSLTGLPAGYTVNSAVSPAYSSPLNFIGTNGVITSTNNNVNIVTPSATFQNVGFSPGPSATNPFSKTVLRGPYNYNADISLYKVFAIKEGMFFRVNFDAFNAFNIQGTPNPNTTSGEIVLAGNGAASSYWTPRQVQLSARFTF